MAEHPVMGNVICLAEARAGRRARQAAALAAAVAAVGTVQVVVSREVGSIVLDALSSGHPILASCAGRNPLACASAWLAGDGGERVRQVVRLYGDGIGDFRGEAERALVAAFSDDIRDLIILGAVDPLPDGSMRDSGGYGDETLWLGPFEMDEQDDGYLVR